MSCQDHLLPSYYIPYDVVFEILIRVPKKRSIVRFKCVSREWKHMISHDSWFHEMRRNYKRRRRSARKQEAAWILRMSHYRFICSKGRIIKVSCEMKDSEQGTVIKEFVLPHCYYINTIWDPKTPSRCDNLLFYYNGRGKDLYLYDTKTDRVHALARSSFCTDFDFTYGFGYSSKSDEYKVVHLYQNDESSDIMSCEVYSTPKAAAAAAGTWRKISEDCPCLVRGAQARGVVANNMIHWMSEYYIDRRFALVSFDLNEEKFTTMPFSDSEQYHTYGIYLANLKGMLCLVNQPISYYEERDMRLRVWAVKDYSEGTWECWCDISLGFVYREERLHVSCFEIFRVAYVGNEELVFVARFRKDDYREVYCDMRESRITRVVDRAYGSIIISGNSTRI